MKKLVSIVVAALVVMASVPAMAAIEIIIPHRAAPMTFGWSTATSATNKYGFDYRYVKQAATATYTAVYTPNIPVTSSDWQVYVWYPTITSQTTSAQYIVHRTSGGDVTVTKNQTLNRGTWVLIGTYTMGAGTNNNLKITNVGSTSTYVAADAVRFYSATAIDIIPATISGVTSIPGTSSVVINWTTNEQASSQVDYGLTASYGSSTTKDINPVTNHQIVVTGLTPSTTYHFRVKSTDVGSNTTTSGDYVFTTLASTTPEFRGCWIYTWGNSILSAAQISTAVDTLSAANYNVLIPEIRKAGDAYYNSAYEPRASNIIDPPPFDPLQDIITKGHAKGMEVHGWLTTYRIWSSGFGTAPVGHIWRDHPEYAMKTSSGGTADGSNYNLDPGVPAVQDYIAKVLIDMITKYDLDGLDFDYVRYPGTDWGYNEITKQRFFNEYGYNPPTSSGDPNWGVWCDYRRQQVTDLVRKCYVEVIWRKPWIKMSADTVGWTQGDPNVDYTGTRQYNEVFQNAKYWMEQHIIDMNRLMNYKREYDCTQAADLRVWNRWLGTMQQTSGRHSVSGPGTYMNYTPDCMTQLAQARSENLSGVATYVYHQPNIGDTTSAVFFDTLKTQVFPQPAPIPDMPWKSAPTTGIVFGNVTNSSMTPDSIHKNWIYKATVTLTGPYPSTATRTALSDATGTYAFMDVAPGTYSVSVAKAGQPSKEYTAQLLRAGDVVREDFDLGTVTATSPAGTIVPGWSWFSLPLEPVDPAPESVLTGLAIDGNLFRWDSPTLSQVMYDMWRPDIFGPLTVGDGYLYRTEDTTPYTISYTAYSGSPAMKSLSLPYAGWALIGCPFTREANWENALVTKDGVTTDLRTASQYGNNWISSTGFWWNNAEQSQYDIGLPEDWPSGGTTLVPWRGYWISTFQDGLTLHLRQTAP